MKSRLTQYKKRGGMGIQHLSFLREDKTPFTLENYEVQFLDRAGEEISFTLTTKNLSSLAKQIIDQINYDSGK